MLTITFVTLACVLLVLKYRRKRTVETKLEYRMINYLAVIACALTGFILSCS